MIDGQEPSPPDAPLSEDAPANLGNVKSAHETRSGDDKIATKPPEKKENDFTAISNDQDDEMDADGDSEAETLIESPEKRKPNALDNPPRLEPPVPIGREATIKDEPPSSQSSENNSRKRKRSNEEGKDGLRGPMSRQSSPLSSPMPDAHSGSESGASIRLRNASRRTPSSFRRLAASDRDSKDGENRSQVKKGSTQKAQKRRKSEFEETPHRPLRRRHTPDAGGSERRETRSATYSRSDSPQRSRSLSPRPKGEHRRKISVQSIQTLASHKTRRLPAPLITKRNRSSDRSSDASTSPAPTRPALHKFASTDNDATSPAKIMAKKLRDKHGRTFLAQACTDDRLERVKQVFEDRPQDLNTPDNAGNTPLQIAALQGHLEIVEFLLQKSADPNTRNIEKETPLIDAVENGHIEVVRILLKHGADPRIGNATGQKPIELVDPDDNEIRKLLIEAKHKSFKRRQSEDQAPASHNREGSSRAASAASPRDSPPLHGPKSPPPLQLSRRRAREQTRNDLLWQANTPENLTKLAGKGDTEGVVNILNILNKASPEALIAACKGGHDEVLQLLIAMGNADPDPDPVLSSDQRKGYNTPILAAIGEGNLQSVKLLIEQDGFNPTRRRYKGRSYFELALDRKGDNWKEESELLKRAFEAFDKTHPKQGTPRKAKDLDRHHIRGSSSPMSQRAKSPTRTQTDGSGRRDGRPAHSKRAETRDSLSGEHSKHATAVSSDHDRGSLPHKGHKTRRSRTDIPTVTSEEEVHKRRRLISRKEALKNGSSHAEPPPVDENPKKANDDPDKLTAKRRRSSVATETAHAPDLTRMKKRSRRTLSDSSPEEVRTLKKQISRPNAEPRSSPDNNLVKNAEAPAQKTQHTHKQRKESSLQSDTSVNLETIPQATIPESEASHKETQSKEAMEHTEKVRKQKEAAEEIAKRITQQAEAAAKAQAQAKIHAEAQAQAHTQAQAQAQAEAEAEARAQAEAEAQAQAQAEAKARADAEAEAEAQRAEEERLAAAARKLAEEAAAAKKKAEEEAAAALARKKEEEERQERMRREAEEKQRRAEERRQRILRDAEMRRMESLPNLLCLSAKLIDAQDPEAKGRNFLSRFMPLYTMKTRQIDASCNPDVADEEWIPGFQAAPLLASKNLGLEHLTHWEKRKMNDKERMCLWRIARTMLIKGSDVILDMNWTMDDITRLSNETFPKFEAMQPLVWVKLSDFHERLPMHPYLHNLSLRTQKIGIMKPFKTVNAISPTQISPPGTLASRPISSAQNGLHMAVNTNAVASNSHANGIDAAPGGINSAGVSGNAGSDDPHPVLPNGVTGSVERGGPVNGYHHNHHQY